ncbi:hypothetical protein AX16_007054 [Volvariella volvacea WC 439]|nr:hypothetical protein AX16_007054 [Volvariella volvacea WC 439]
MLALPLTTLLATAALTVAAPSTLMYSNTTSSSDRQRTSISPEHRLNVERVFRTFHPPPSLFRGPNDSPAIIPVYWHVISTDQTVEGGWLPHEQITAQMNVLNQDFAETGLIFQHIKTFRVVQPDWFFGAEGSHLPVIQKPGIADENEVKKGGDLMLLVSLGRAVFPAEYQFNPILDGIILSDGTLPGGYLAPYNLGRTLTHEVGHWVGLYHTFEGGCDGGDEVSDTAAENVEGEGCLIGRDTCPQYPGADPVQNFMDYSDDSCMTHFTPGQIQRL